MMFQLRSFLAAAMLFVLFSSIHASDLKYVFFLIGDGMSLNHRTAAEYYKNALKTDKMGIVPLTMNSLPVQAMTITYATDSYVTDSAAAGTALATGKKTYSGAIGVDEMRKPLESIAKFAGNKGMKVGILTSVSIDHATPACFYANSDSRNKYYEILKQLPTSGFDFFAGGPKGDKYAKKNGWKTVHEMAEEAGYTIINSRDALKAAKPGAKTWFYNKTLDSAYAMLYEIDKVDEQVSLAEQTEAAIRIMDNPNGFFMMVEGGKIDWAAHSNDAKTVIDEVLAFDDVVKVAYDFYKKHPEETLILVTGDHETGGISLGCQQTKYAMYPKLLQMQTISSTNLVDKVNHWRENGTSFEDAFAFMKTQFPLEKLSIKEELGLRTAFKVSMTPYKERKATPALKFNYGGYDPFVTACIKIANARSGIGWTTYAHSASPVPISVVGYGQDVFQGYYNNTEVPKKIKQLLNR
jgi:alkaline phosphatase